MVAGAAGAGLCVTPGFLAAGLFFSMNAPAAGLRLRIGAGAPAFGVVEFGPEGGVGAAELFMMVARGRQRRRVSRSRYMSCGRNTRFAEGDACGSDDGDYRVAS